MNGDLWVRVGAISGAISVGMGAFAAHGLRSRVLTKTLEPRMLEVFHTGAQYQMYHSLALIAVGVIMLTGRSSSALTFAGWSFVAGILLFSGSLYAMPLTGLTKLGAITPFGGIAFILGWAALALGIGQSTKIAL